MTMTVWNKLAKPPASALKPISGGRLSGKTDVNPQWRMQALTEEFGPCGIGWKYTIDRVWTEQANGPEMLTFALVTLYVKPKGSESWSDGIPGIGGNKMVEMESRGAHNSDECYKMAVTDALSVACKALGVAAEVYLGNWDGAKYRDTPPAASPPKNDQTAFADPKPKPFVWANASSAEKRDYSITRIRETVNISDPVQAQCKLNDISGKLSNANFSKEDADLVAAELVAAEAKINSGA
ncbi:MAG TPA: hypothetical protein VNA25_09860 [Phycisphaerae bacterium]|nr:hypothetical protein [Phycisphaerae bacterium]